MGWLLKPSSLIKSGNLCVPFATHQSNHNLMRNREWIESSSCGMAVLRGNDILMTTHIYVMKVVMSTFCYENTVLVAGRAQIALEIAFVVQQDFFSVCPIYEHSFEFFSWYEKRFFRKFPRGSYCIQFLNGFSQGFDQFLL